MLILLIVLTLVVGLPGLVLGAATVRAWDPRNDPDYLRDTVQHGVVAFLKLGLLLLLICTGAITVAASIIAYRNDTDVAVGVWVCAALTLLIAAGFIRHWLRLHRARQSLQESRPS